jgi:hypothetical protein
MLGACRVRRTIQRTRTGFSAQKTNASRSAQAERTTSNDTCFRHPSPECRQSAPRAKQKIQRDRPSDGVKPEMELGGAAEDVAFHVALARWFGDEKKVPVVVK